MLSKTGGLIYHWRAFRYRNSVWAPFRQNISHFLDAWNPEEKSILIIGASGGHTLPSDFLERFDEVLLSDPDPLARIVFRKNHPGVKSRWISEDLVFENKKYAPEKLTSYLKAHPDTAVLFANLIGQLPLINKDLDQLKLWWQSILPTLSQHSWASYHDLFSFDLKKSVFPDRIVQGPVLPVLIEWAKLGRISVDIIDHGTSDLFEKSPESFVWRISPYRIHIIGQESYRRTKLD